MSLAALVTSVLNSGILISGFLMVGMLGSFVSGMGAVFLAVGSAGALCTPTPSGFDEYKCIRTDKHLQAEGAPESHPR